MIFFLENEERSQGWVQQPNCLLLQFVHVGDLNIKLDEPAMTGPMEEIIGLDGFRELLTFLKFEYLHTRKSKKNHVFLMANFPKKPGKKS